MIWLTLVKLPRMESHEIEDLLQEQMLCRIAFKGGKYPYMAPFQYVVMNDALYFHFTDYGKKMRLLERDNRVCVEIEKFSPDLSEYNFVVLRGNLKIVKDPRERGDAIKLLVEEGEQKISTNFLGAHGFRKDEGWTALSPEKPLMIVKLVKVIEKIGLKSP